MKIKLLNQNTFIIASFLIIGCYNNPTPPSEIIGSQISGFQYGLLDCQKINDEIMFLEEREKTLVIAQEKRVRDSKVQQWWTEGDGKGDGFEALELYRVRGELNAARKIYKNKECI